MFTVPGVDNAPDFYGDVNHPDLTVFFAGNQYMVVNTLLAAFKKSYLRLPLSWNTLPAGFPEKKSRVLPTL